MKAIVVAATVVLLTACHADVAERVNINADNSITVTYHEILDQEAFADMTAVGGSDPFRMSLARAAGWKVAASDSGSGDHIITFEKTVSSAALHSLRLPDGAQNDPTASGFTFSPGLALPLLIDLGPPRGGPTRANTIPALLRPQGVLQRPGHDPNARIAVANALANARDLDSFVSVHLELAQPLGTAVATNGSLMPDGTVRWDLHFAKPTVIGYSTARFHLYVTELPVIAVLTRSDAGRAADTPPLPQGAGWSPVYASGVRYGRSPIAAWQSLGRAGTYDFQRWGQESGKTDAAYAPARNFAVGVYLTGTKLAESLIDALYPIMRAHM